jgi:spore coat protein A
MDTPALSRRDLLKVSLFGAAAVALPRHRGPSPGNGSRLPASSLPPPFTVPFAAPPVLQPTVSDATTDYYRIVQTPFVGEVLPGVATPLWGYNGMVPGPTIKARQGRRTVVRQVNQLPATHPTLGYVPWTSTHLHGMPARPQFDGYASDVTQPGQWKDYEYPNTGAARTLWYHDHGVHHTAENVYMGLLAQYQLTDPQEEALPIPRGRYDLPLILSDVSFAADGSLLWDDHGHSGVFGDVVLVNGRPWPTLPVEQRRYRFRVLNASVSRAYTLELSTGQPMQVIATDGGLMAAPQSVTQLRVGMAERYEVVLDFTELGAGATVQLRNSGVRGVPGGAGVDQVMQFEVTGPATSTEGNEVPAVLGSPAAMAVAPAAARVTRTLRLDRTRGLWTINGETWDDVVASGFTRVFADPAVGDVEIWEVENRSRGWSHPLHTHLVDFQVLSRNGAPPPAQELGPKDTVYVGEAEVVRLLIQFGPEHGRYMIHCHNVAHEDHDMMIQYQVGQLDAASDPINAAPPRSGPETPLGGPG